MKYSFTITFNPISIISQYLFNNESNGLSEKCLGFRSNSCRFSRIWTTCNFRAPDEKKSKPEPEIKMEVHKAITLYYEKSRSGKQRSSYRVFVVASDGKGLVA